jgi:branched-chain amino acid transport system ATP-binding protein
VLQVENIHTYYGASYILHGISLNVGEKEVVSLLGRNGAGKTTTIRSIMGLAPPREGRIIFHEIEIGGKPPHEIFRCGIKLVPQGKQILPTLTVEENLKLAMLKTEVEGSEKTELEKVYEKFPILKERRKQPGGYLSGGERQMLAIARVLIGKTGLILLDEPTEGLAPLIVREIKETIKEIKGEGVALLLAEQNVKMALEVAERHYIIDKGTVKFEGTTEQLRDSLDILETYLGVTA